MLKTHVGFSVPEYGKIDSCLRQHFVDLGYALYDQQPNKWYFERGKKSATLWRFNIRAYKTWLLVEVATQPGKELWVSCDWEVYTFLSVVTGGDVDTLRSEGLALESALRRLNG